ncbi:MAG: Lsr2 family protein [Mycobacterium sp.]|nr:MAG: Lsr2 family protein [Mycobacterium sp.]
MASRVQVVLEDDIDGGEAERTVSFAFDGVEYEIDLSAANAAALAEALAPYIDAGRRVSGRKGRRSGAAGGSRSSAAAAGGATDTAAVRAWAQDQGIQIASRGRLSAEVIAQYNAAHS